MKTHGRKETVDYRVAQDLGLPMATVQVVTTSFLEQCRHVLIEYGALRLRGLGRLSAVVVEKQNPKTGCYERRLRVTLSREPALKSAMQKRNEEVPYGEVRSGRIRDC